ncbi:MFS transporter [Candidatus Poribacteria bacterium]|nr:MFS transporter [Candidatus Poribacteria bacterium]
MNRKFMQKSMLFRFSLYGFLKNQQYYAPFIILAFREKGLSFFLIGILVGFREICINLFEIPSGAVADLYGRRRAMMFSFISYIISFAVFALSKSIILLFLAMFFFALGEAFRTGTHKAMIFDWLRIQGRVNEKTRVYGYTRSWSKIGSALSVIIAAALVFYSGSYNNIFWFSIIPYILGIINFFGYDAVLDGERKTKFSIKSVALLLKDAFREVTRMPSMRRLITESMTFQGMFNVGKYYLQPILKQAAVALPVLVALEDKERGAILVGFVYFILNILAFIASRQSHKLSNWRGGEESTARSLWYANWLMYLVLIPLLWFKINVAVITIFIILSTIMNFWRPVMLSRINVHSTPEISATVLSIESQSISVTTMIIAPLLGWLVDKTGAFWPVGVTGSIISTIIIFSYMSKKHEKLA